VNVISDLYLQVKLSSKHYISFSIYKNIVDITMGTICAPLLDDCSFIRILTEFIERLLKKNEKKLAWCRWSLFTK